MSYFFPPETYGFPVAPGRIPVIGHLHRQYTDYPGFLKRSQEACGKRYWTQGGGDWCLVSADEESFAFLKNRGTTNEHYQKIAHRLLGDSLLVKDGKPHSRVRSAMNAPFLPKGLSASEVGPMMAETIGEHVQTWVGLGKFPVLARTRELTLHILFRMIGVDTTELDQWRHHYEEFMLGGISIPFNFPGSPAYRAERARVWLDTRLTKIIEDVRQNPAPGKLVSELVHGKNEEGQTLGNQDLIENLRLLCLAGHETTASTMAWILFYLGQDPALWERVVAESLAAPGVPNSPKELRAFPLAEGVFREALRLHPPVAMVTRLTTAPYPIGDQTLPAGIQLGTPIYTLCRDPERYPDPERFYPDRWIRRPEPPGAVETIAFGGGPHFCLGYHVAWMECVQLSVALARGLGPLGKRPKLVGDFPRTIYLPLGHPDAKGTVEIV